MPIDNLEAPIPNITVTGQRLGMFGPIGGVDFGSNFQQQGSRFPSIDLRNLGFLSPALPQVVEEIVVTAARPASTVARAAAGTGATGSSLFLIGALGVGWALKKSIDDLVDQHFNEEHRERLAKEKSEAEQAKRRAEIYKVEVLAPPATPGLEEITKPVPLRRAPQPVLPNPDADPFIMIPISPAVPDFPTVPDVVVVPDVVTPSISPTETPTELPLRLPLPIRLPQPDAVPRPAVRPLVTPLPYGDPAPYLQPFEQPKADPAPQTRPFVSDPFASPLTTIDPRSVALPQPFRQPQPDFDDAQANCPPCKKCKEDDDEPRDECFKQLVKQGRFAVDDTTYNWVAIDCDTGKEL